MKTLAQSLSLLALLLTLSSPLLFVTDHITLPKAQLWMLISALLWFGSAPFWMEHKSQ